GEVHHHPGEGLVQRHIAVAVAGDALLVSYCPGHGLANGDADVFHGVVIVDVGVTVAVHFEVHHAVAGDLVHHVIQEGNAGGEADAASSIQVQFDADFGFESVALDAGDAFGGHVNLPLRRRAVGGAEQGADYTGSGVIAASLTPESAHAAADRRA